MGSNYTVLPFERGKTFSDGNSNVISATKNLQLLGKTYVVPDTVHGSGRDVTLRVMMWTGSAITASTHTIYNVDTTAGYFASRITAEGSASTAIAMPMDDAMATGTAIPQYDLVYCVQEGPCDIEHDGDSTLTLGAAVTHGASGRVLTDNIPAAGEFRIGILDEDPSAVAGEEVRVMVNVSHFCIEEA